jgi:hypothetical protein
MHEELLLDTLEDRPAVALAQFAATCGVAVSPRVRIVVTVLCNF